jgi:hypothetical protein
MAHLKKRKKHYTLEGYGDFPGIKGCAPGFQTSTKPGLAQRISHGTIRPIRRIEYSPLKKKHFLQSPI